MATVGRFFRAPSTHYFLFGPRGTGKSTWLGLPIRTRCGWTSSCRRSTGSARPERLRELVAGDPDRPVVVIDEVQKAPVLLDVVHPG